MDILYGPFHDQFEVLTSTDTAPHGLPAPRVDAHLRNTLAWIIDTPRNTDTLRRLLHADRHEANLDPSAVVTLDRLVRAIESGALALLPRPRASLVLQLRSPSLDAVPLAEIVLDSVDRRPSLLPAPRVLEWHWTCKHEVDDEPRSCGSHPCFLVVPGPEPREGGLGVVR